MPRDLLQPEFASSPIEHNVLLGGCSLLPSAPFSFLSVRFPSVLAQPHSHATVAQQTLPAKPDNIFVPALPAEESAAATADPFPLPPSRTSHSSTLSPFCWGVDQNYGSFWCLYYSIFLIV